ncbi:IclR family transcriptional regulator [Prauserella shujinwangii]|uniref:IclR family transcriptional regulator n=1 Tax=Prauserella shujinwangii TaxID=1453103 RepID=UPI0015E5B6BB|nr:IclR family transcriptional regulator [Prauserella shujinwangii]
MNPARLDRAFAVLGYLANHHDGRSVKHLSDDLGLPMSSTHDLLQALLELGAVRLVGQRSYALGPRSIGLALSIVDSVKLRQVARPYLIELCEEVNENTYLAVRSGDEVVYADRYEASQLLSVVIQLGGGRPLHASAVGKLIAAFDPELQSATLTAPRLEPLTPYTLTNREFLREEYVAIQSRAYSVSDGESVEGIIGLATPIMDANGAVVAAVHISAPRGRLSPDRCPVVLTQMLRTGARISRQLGAPAEAMPQPDLDEVIALEEKRRKEKSVH